MSGADTLAEQESAGIEKGKEERGHSLERFSFADSAERKRERRARTCHGYGN